MKDSYYINLSGLDSIYSRLYNKDIASYIELKDSVQSVYNRIVSGDHDAASASAVQEIHQRLRNDFERYVRLTGVMMKATEIYSTAENEISLKAKLGGLIMDKWDAMGIGAASALFATTLTVTQLANLGGYGYLEPYQQRAYDYTANKFNADLFLGYGFSDYFGEKGDGFRVITYKMFDTAESELKGLFTNKGYDYDRTRDVLESLVEDYVDYDENALEKVFENSSVKEIMKVCKGSGTWSEVIQKFLEGDKEIVDAIEELRYNQELSDFFIVFDDVTELAKAAKGISDVFEYGEWMSKVGTPILTDYTNSIAALESMRSCELFGDSDLQNRVIDDMILDYNNSVQMSLKEAATITGEELLKLAMKANPVTGAVKLIDVSISTIGAVTGENVFTSKLQDYWTLTNMASDAKDSFRHAFEKLQSGVYSAEDVVKFEESFKLNRAFSLKLCETEVAIIQHRYGDYPQDKSIQESLAIVNQQINQLNNMKLDDSSTWMHSDGKVYNLILRGD